MFWVKKLFHKISKNYCDHLAPAVIVKTNYKKKHAWKNDAECHVTKLQYKPNKT